MPPLPRPTLLAGGHRLLRSTWRPLSAIHHSNTRSNPLSTSSLAAAPYAPPLRSTSPSSAPLPPQPPLPSSSPSILPASSPSPTASPAPTYGFFGSIANLLLPLLRPFRGLLGLKTLALSDATYRRAATFSTPPLLSLYSLTPHPLTGLSPLTTLHLFITHSFFSALILSHPSHPTPPLLLRATLEALWSDLSATLAHTTPTLRQQPTLRDQQQQLLGLFKALDLTLKEEPGAGRDALLWSVLRGNLYGAGESLRGYELEVRALAGWVQENWDRVRREAEDAPAEGKMVELTPLPELREERRAEAEATVRYVGYRVETVNGADRIVLVQPKPALRSTAGAV